MEDYIACVRFTDSLKSNEFVLVKEIKQSQSDKGHIQPKSTDDLDPTNEYSVLWCLCESDDCQDTDNKCVYYPAYILCIAGKEAVKRSLFTARSNEIIENDDNIPLSEDPLGHSDDIEAFLEDTVENDNEQDRNNRTNAIDLALQEGIGNQQNRDRFIRMRQHRIFEERQVAQNEINEDEREIDLYKTPEAQLVDARDKQKYQVDGNMIYLGEGRAVDKNFWDFLKLRGDWIFLRETAELICGKQNLVNRCIKQSKISINIRDRSPRKAITPGKYFLIRELFEDYIAEKDYDKKKRDKLMTGINRHLGYKIKDLRKALY
ncbi:hypothetical protein TSAR_001187 [Trichomalopsis sarcophagae]|uniref:BEN domain-containing protein n=1 Tax=Trichomalopsis sarcophagae TaxID=543379 RepID=A0A232EE56_9HYME|nr:hypothetical protein TSAR_001187 [Trichomalopsis sarcophagae]